MRHLPCSLLCIALLAPLPAAAQVLGQSPAYAECTELAKSAPDKALAKADEWLKVDDSVPAYHCRAMALFGLSRFVDAGDTLEVARDKSTDIGTQTYLTQQAVKAWVSAGKSDNALKSIGRQLDSMGRTKNDNATASRLTAQLLLERANIRSNFGQWREAVKDLDHAITLTPLNVEVLLARAAAFQQLGDTGLAAEDAKSVLILDPKNEKAKELLKSLDSKLVIPAK